jgi:hypothetical protein
LNGQYIQKFGKKVRLIVPNSIKGENNKKLWVIKELKKLLAKPNLIAPQTLYVSKAEAQDQGKEEAEIVGKERIEIAKLATQVPYIMDQGKAYRGLFRVLDKVCTTNHPDAELVKKEGRKYEGAITQFGQVAREFKLQVDSFNIRNDIAKVSIIDDKDNAIKNSMRNYKIVKPVVGAQVCMYYYDQGHLEPHIEQGKIVKVHEDGTFEHDMPTRPGASAVPILNPQATKIYGWHVRGGNGETNTARYFNEDVHVFLGEPVPKN